MPDAFSAYPYLTCGLVGSLLFVALAWATLSRAQFALTLLSGLIAVPAFIFGWFLEYNYWHPERIGGRNLGIEDAIISFAMSALAWYVVAIVWGRRMEFRYYFLRSLRRYLTAVIGPVAAFLFWVWMGCDGMTALLLAYGCVGPVLWWLQRDLRPLALLGAPLFALAWYTFARTSIWAYPGFLESWNLDGRWGVVVAGVPLGEIVWAFFYGAYWPLFVTVVYEVKLHPREHSFGR